MGKFPVACDEEEIIIQKDTPLLAAGSFIEFFNMDSETEKESIKKLGTLQNLKYVFTSHYGFTEDVSKAFNKH